jgi:hypothetical protein
MADLLSILYEGLISSAEKTTMAYLETNPWTDLFGNYVGGTAIFPTNGKITELVGMRMQDGRIWHTHIRYYTVDDPTAPDYGIPLQNAAQILINPNTREIYTTPVSQGGAGGKVEPLPREAVKFCNPVFQLLGGLDEITGAIFPYRTSDISTYDKHSEDIRLVARGQAVDIGFDYFRDNATSIGTSYGVPWYVAKLPRMDRPFDIFNPTKYEFGLMNKYLSTGIGYYLLDPLFHIPKETLVKLDERTAGNKTIVVDPLIEIQLNLAKKMERVLGPSLLAAYPFLFLGHPFIEILKNTVVEPIQSITDDIVSGVEGLFSPYPPAMQKARARTCFKVPKFARGGLSDAGPIEGDNIIRPDFSRRSGDLVEFLNKAA